MTDEQPNDPTESHKHPTGDPELTGGWFQAGSPPPPGGAPAPEPPAEDEAAEAPEPAALSPQETPPAAGEIAPEALPTESAQPEAVLPPQETPPPAAPQSLDTIALPAALLPAPPEPPALPTPAPSPIPPSSSPGPAGQEKKVGGTRPGDEPTLTTTFPVIIPPAPGPESRERGTEGIRPATVAPPPRRSAWTGERLGDRPAAPPPLPPTARGRQVPAGGARAPLPPPARVPAARAARPGGPPAQRSAETTGASGVRWPVLKGSCLLQALLAALIGGMLLLICGSLATTAGYLYLSRDLPSIDDLQARAASFETTYLYDRNGSLLYELNDPAGGHRTTVELTQISPYLQQATIDTEDKYFYTNPGFDPIGIARAIKQAAQEGEAVSGASTITQQLVRALVFSPEEAAERSLQRKLREIILASEISRRYSKDEILTLYLNQIYYGNLAYGIEAASQTYYGVPAKDLTLAQASLLAGLPQAPAIYDPFTNYDAVLVRQKQVLALMVEQKHITRQQADEASAWAQANPPTPPNATFAAPHFVNYVRRVIEEQYGAGVYRNGLKVTTTLDPALQSLAEQSVRDELDALAQNPRVRNVTNGALVAIDPRRHELLAMVGSVDFNNEQIGGQVNVALRCRQPGSSIKPLTYLTAMRGFDSNGRRVYWTPGTLIWDVPTDFPDQPGQPYHPQNYDGRFHGPVALRSALANSYNIPAVRTLQFVGVAGLLNTAAQLGVLSIADPVHYCPDYPYQEEPAYGLALTLGGGETTLLEMANAYAILANGGRAALDPQRQNSPALPVVLLKVTDGDGNVLLDNTPPETSPVISSGDAYLITSILSDNAARRPAFGEHSWLELTRPAAVKTGTTNDYRDNWTIGYTPSLVAGVWVGNNDNTPMEGVVSGVTGAAPIWHNFMEGALQNTPVEDFVRPADVVETEICADSGTLPSERCVNRRREVFLASQPPPPAQDDLWRKVAIDKFTGLRVNEFCPNNAEDQWFGVLPEEQVVRDWVNNTSPGQEWAHLHNFIPLPEWLALPPDQQNEARQQGKTPLLDPPKEFCNEQTGAPTLVITLPGNGQEVAGTLDIIGTAKSSNFAYFRVEYGFSHDPQAWGVVGPDQNFTQVENGVLATWDTTSLQPGDYSLRLVLVGTNGGQVESQPVRLRVVAPTPTPTDTPVPTATATLVPSATPFPTATDTPVFTVTPLPSDTPAATNTAPPPAEFTPTDTPPPTSPPLPSDTPTVPPPDITPTPGGSDVTATPP
jgi:penicillin-binding protein 1C